MKAEGKSMTDIKESLVNYSYILKNDIRIYLYSHLDVSFPYLLKISMTFAIFLIVR